MSCLLIQFVANQFKKMYFLFKPDLVSLFDFIYQLKIYFCYFSNSIDYTFFTNSIYCKSISFCKFGLR